MLTRESGSLRLVNKKAGAKTYTSWQWRTHHQHDLGHKKVDLELGNTLWGMRTRLYVALGELKAKTLVERYARWHFCKVSELKAYTGDRGDGRAAWWMSFPELLGGWAVGAAGMVLWEACAARGVIKLIPYLGM